MARRALWFEITLQNLGSEIVFRVTQMSHKVLKEYRPHVRLLVAYLSIRSQ